MQPRKSRPQIDRRKTLEDREFENEDRTLVEVRERVVARMAPLPSVLPTGSRSTTPRPAPVSAPVRPVSAHVKPQSVQGSNSSSRSEQSNVIPFAKPRAISSMPVTFSSGSSGKVGSQSGNVTSVHVPFTASPVTSAPPIVGNSWGSAAVAAAASPASMIAPPPAVKPMATPSAGSPAPSMFQPVKAGTTMPNAPTAVMTVPDAPPVSDDVPSLASVKPSRWAAFENLGLHAPKLDPKTLSKHVVSAYRLLGFVILTIIVIALVAYLITTAFFYMSDSWIVPMAISPTDEKVVTLQAQLSERQTNRDRTAAELDQAERAIAVQQEFQLQFAKAIKSDLEGRKAALARMYELSSIASSTRAQIKRSNSAYATASQRRMAEEWKAGLIDRNTMLNGKFQLAQINGSNLSLAEKQAEYETRAADLDAQTRSLEALLVDGSHDGTPLSYDVLKIKQEYESSRLETQRAIENRDMLRSALERDEKLLTSLKASSYLKALADQAHVAFVPYSNLSNVKKGEPVYGCALTMVFCKRVGTVLEVLPGEVQSKHPNRDKQLRGQMVELKLEDNSAATDDVLFVGGRPLLI